MVTLHREWGGGRGLAERGRTHTWPGLVGLSLCPGHSRLAARCPGHLLRGQPRGRWRGQQAVLLMPEVRGLLGGPLPRAFPERGEWMNQSQLIRAFHAQPAPMTDLETAWSCAFSGFLRHTPEQAQVFIISIHIPFD